MEFNLSEAYFKIFKCIESSNYFQLQTIPTMLDSFKKLYGENLEYKQLTEQYNNKLKQFELKTKV